MVTHILLLHSPKQSIILLTITPAYRTFLRSCFCKMPSQHSIAVSGASVTSIWPLHSNRDL
ncbi:hypothetical protein PRIPAC_88851 [Pristionchus pacificus]|uniref:Uncharacterized protein n=1 Tax=Pristionchus pacificus TaxID=54126 RepID=A0A2A6CWL0_PRIPA|nr:hypothetical protein PRIPAC_88851 [Pristionchus pacificus]|eukprot:PDM82624.1 hypothetical protein PRIPAC_37017 [Pristionchus pacificus]